LDIFNIEYSNLTIREQAMMKSSSDYTPDPKAETEWLIQAFFEVIDQQIGDPVQVQHVRTAIQQQQAALEAAYETWIVDEQARYNLKSSAVVLAAYRVLQPSMPQADLLALLRRAFIEPFREVVKFGTAQMLDHAPNPFQALVATSKTRELYFFGKSFSFERPRDDERAYYCDVTRCLWHSFFVAEGAPQLTPIFCEFDANWIDAIDPVQHGLQFVRATTLGYGGQLCAFHFHRLAPQEPQS
jgi:hypothetical protein